MKFVKENLTLVICGSVVLLVLLFCYAPIPGASVPAFKDALTTDMQNRYTVVDSMKQDGNTPLDLAGQTGKGIPPKSWVEHRKTMIDKMNQQLTDLAGIVASDNAKGRVNKNGDMIFPSVGTAALPGRDAYTYNFGTGPGAGDASEFKFKHYIPQFRLWTGLLATGSLKEMDFAEALPPTAESIKSAWDEKQKIEQAKLPGGGTQPGAGGMAGFGNGAMTAESQKQFIEFAKGRIMKRAAGDGPAIPGIRMYIEPTAFQQRPWVTRDTPPAPDEVFYGFVDSWLQADVVRAIHQTNTESLRNVAPNVGHSAIKRLVRIVVGNSALTRYVMPAGGSGGAVMGGQTNSTTGENGSPFFMGSTIPGSGTPTGVPVTGPPVADSNAGQIAPKPGGWTLPGKENATDYTLSMTGRSAGKTYDVVYMSIVLDMDPAKLLTFEDKFLRQNPGYTIINTQMHTMDPLERAANGYLYGDGQVSEFEFTVECVLFRKWTDPIMPDDVKKAMGATQNAPAAP